ncbi:MAG TPA: hypothetical protein VF669_13275 [Tepidisphaeraceae bacterium]|jgi:hypothetical protein
MRRPLLYTLLLITLTGCASRKRPFNEWFASEKYQDYVPKTAQPVTQGAGVISFTAPERGTVYVIDTSQAIQIKETTVPHALGSGFVMKNAVVSFNPATGQVSSNGKPDFKIQNVQPSHTHELRFDPIKRPESE